MFIILILYVTMGYVLICFVRHLTVVTGQCLSQNSPQGGWWFPAEAIFTTVAFIQHCFSSEVFIKSTYLHQIYSFVPN